MSKERFQIIILIGLIVMGLSYAYGMYFLQPQLSRLEFKQSELNSRKAEYQKLMMYSVNPQVLEKEIKTQESERARISKSLPVTLDKPILTYNIYSAVKRNNLIAESVVFGQPENKGSYQVMSISFSVSGSTRDILSIVQELQNSSDALVLRSVSFIAKDEGMKAELKLQAYAMNGKKESDKKPPFMDAPLGIDSIPMLFSKK